MASLKELLGRCNQRNAHIATGNHLPISDPLVEEFEITLPKVTDNLDSYQQKPTKPKTPN
jgi:hypothetical protein